MSAARLEMGDNVRVRASPATEAAGLVGLAGQVYGFTTPSVTGIVPIGDAAADRAYCVLIQARSAEFWLTPDQLDFVDHGAGTTATVGRSTFVRTEDGSWKALQPAAAPAKARAKPWWKFWG